MTSLDGHRISIRKIELKDSYSPIKVVVPGKTLSEVSKILTGGTEDDVHNGTPETDMWSLNLTRQLLSAV